MTTIGPELAMVPYVALILYAGGILLPGHLFWAGQRRKEPDWPWNWRLLVWPLRYIDWRSAHHVHGPRSAYIADLVTSIGPMGLDQHIIRVLAGIPPHSEQPVDLPRSTREEPFVGYKGVNVVWNEGRWRFNGAFDSYDLDATAQCLRYSATHTAPGQSCSCGFHALSERPVHLEYGPFLATVELFGTVIVGEHGWRASRQRILRVEAPPFCQHATRDLRWVGSEERISAMGVWCGADAVAFATAVTSRITLVPTCETHARKGDAITPAELTGLLGTEVGWAS